MGTNYGLPYMGSKQKIADRILALMPKAGVFYDLFAGGMSITHAVLLGNKYGKIVANDINGEMGKLFVEAATGMYRNERRWISREDFQLLKDSEQYIKICWSFGYNGENYLYSKEIEPIKRACWGVCFAETTYERRIRLGILGDELKAVEDEKERLREFVINLCNEYEVECIRGKDGIPKVEEFAGELKKAVSNKIRIYLKNALEESGKTQSEVCKMLGNQMAGHYFGESQWTLPTRENYEKMRTFIPGLKKRL